MSTDNLVSSITLSKDSLGGKITNEVPKINELNKVEAKEDKSRLFNDHRKKWFTDVDIDNALTKLIKNDKFIHLNPIIVLLLASVDDANNSHLPATIFQCDTILCPLNIDNQHWVLVVYDKLNGETCIVDPLQSRFRPETVLSLTEQLNMNLNNCLNLNNKIITDKYQELKKQPNDYDCGPYVCAYCHIICNPERNFRINKNTINSMRYELFVEFGIDGKGTLKGSGSSSLIKETNFLIKDDVISLFFNSLNLGKNVVLLDNTAATAILDGATDYLVKYVNFDSLKCAKLVFVLVNAPMNGLMLLTMDFIDSSFFVINPRHRIVNDAAMDTASTILQTVLEVRGHGEKFVLGEAPEHDVRGSGLFSNLLICYIIENYPKYNKLTGIDFGLMREKLNVFVVNPKVENPINSVNVKGPVGTKTKRLSLKERTERAENILKSLTNANVEEIINVFYNFFPIKKKATEHRPYLGKKINMDSKGKDKASMRFKFLRNMRSTVNSILNDNNSTDRPAICDIVKCYDHEFPDPDKKWSFNEFCLKSKNTLNLDSVSPGEVVYELLKSNNSSPGNDGITYGNLKSLDPKGILLAHLFNRIIESGTIPVGWKNFKTCLIQKPGKSDYKKTSSWRPIALLPTTYKVFSAILSRRLNSWVQENGLLNRAQKGGSRYEGCIEHNAVLTAAIEHNNYCGSPISIAWLDIKEAFPSVPHQYMWSLLRHIGVGNEFVAILELFYKDVSTFYNCGPTSTNNLPIRRGVKQGCPISMLLFSLAINPVLEAIDTVKVPCYRIGESSVRSLAYADDIALVANSERDLQKLIDQAILTTEWAGMHYRPEKCAYLSLPQREMGSAISIYNVKINKLKSSEFYSYLGVPVGDKVDQSPFEILDNLVGDLGKLVNSQLDDWQKLKSYKVFLHSRLGFAFRTREIPARVLTQPNKNSKYKTNITTKVRGYIKTILGLPERAENCYMYTGVDVGGIGLTDLLDEYHLQTIVQGFKLLTTECSYTGKIIADSLRFVAATRVNSSFPSLNSCLEWINGKPALKSNLSKKTWWQRLIDSIEYFVKNHGIFLNFEWSAEEGFSLRIDSEIRGTNIAKQCDRRKLSHLLRSYVSDAFGMVWHTSKRSGYYADTLHWSPRVTRGILNGRLSEKAFKFVHKARTNTLPTLDHPGNKEGVDRLCRRCNKEEESMIHVLQGCLRNMSVYKERHDKVLEIVTELVDKPGRIVVKDHKCALVPQSTERVDLIITNAKRRRIDLVDIKCVLDTIQNFDNTDAKNKAKYAKLRDDIKEEKQGFTVELGTCMVGSLGTIPKDATKLLKDIGVTEKQATWTLLKCAFASIEHSAKVWKLHTTGMI